MANKHNHQQPLDPSAKVKLRFVTNGGRRLVSKKFLEAMLPTLWDEGDRADAIACAADHVRLFNENRVFFYPFAVNLHRTRLLSIHVGGYQHFPWDRADDEIPPFCATCRDWFTCDPWQPIPVEPFMVQGSVATYLCPSCGAIVVEDIVGGKAGETYWVTRQQFIDRFGRNPP